MSRFVLAIGVLCIIGAVYAAEVEEVNKQWCSTVTYCNDGYKCCTQYTCCPTSTVCCRGGQYCCYSANKLLGLAEAMTVAAKAQRNA